MTRKQYIRKALADMCGTRPATPWEYHLVSAMADRAGEVYEFDKE